MNTNDNANILSCNNLKDSRNHTRAILKHICRKYGYPIYIQAFSKDLVPVHVITICVGVEWNS